MGGQQSTRKLTIDNDDPTNVIKVSESVVDRLRGGEVVRNKERGVPGYPTAIPVTPMAVPVGPPVTPMYPQYMYEPSQTSLQLRQNQEQELRRNDAYWQSRINKLEEAHERINMIMEQEYNDAMKEVNGQFAEAPAESRKPMCQEGKKAVMQCYKQYPNEPMRCAREVQAFAECVDQYRTTLIANRG